MSGIKKYFTSPNMQCKVNDDSVLEISNQEVSLRQKSKKDKNIKNTLQTSANILKIDDSNDSTGITHKQGSKLNSSNEISKKRGKIAKSKSCPQETSLRKSLQSEGENSEVYGSSIKSNNDIDEHKGTNAFRVMMDARNKSIGTNSSGKEREESEILRDRNKDVLAKRRIKFEAWADEKGGLKRKMTEETIDGQIKQEMNKRAKRLKKLLTNGAEDKRSDQKIPNEGNDKNVKKKRQKRKEYNISKSHPENVSSSKSDECKDNGSAEKIALKSRNNNTFSLHEAVPDVEEIIVLNEDNASNDEFLSKLNSPMKKNRNLFCYFDKINSNAINLKDKISDKDRSRGVLKTPKSKTKISTPRSKWKIRLIQPDCDTNNSDSSVDSCDSSSEPGSPEILMNSDLMVDARKTGDIKHSKARKLAPLFEKVERNVLDKKEMKAKEEFLKSGVPERFRLMLEKQNSYDKILYPTFPSISHVQQATDSYFWNLPKETLHFLHLSDSKDIENINLEPNSSLLRLGKFTECNRLQCDNEMLMFNTSTYFPPDFFHSYKQVLKQIKNSFPEFPVYKIFRLLKEKNQVNDELLTTKNENNELDVGEKLVKHSKSKKSQKRSQKLKFVTENNVDRISEFNKNIVNDCLWSDAFCPRNSEELIGNKSAINSLKDWLMQWKEFNVMKYKHSNYDSDCSYNSDADFASSNDSFCDSANFKALKNTAVLLGPVGSGKTSTIYLLAKELSYNVIELNASSKRTGKIAFAKLQEATQSHRVRSKDNVLPHIPDNVIKSSDTKKHKKKASLGKQLLSNLKTKNSCEKNSTPNGKLKVLSLILVEDIDIVFEQDEGFISALSQIVQTSKRPIVFTSNDENNVNVQKFMNNLVIKFKAANPVVMTTWLQILCLVNNLYIHNESILQLLDMYNGDMRKTLLQLQYWVLSGGDPNAQLCENNQWNTDRKTVPIESSELYPDESSNLAYNDEKQISKEIKQLNKEEHVCHRKCLLCTCSMKNTEACEHLYTLDSLWFDLSVDKLSSKLKAEKFEDKSLLHNIAGFYDTVSYIDMMLTSIQIVNEEEMHSNFHIQNVGDYLLKDSYTRSAVDPHLHHKTKENYNRFRQEVHRSISIFGSATNERIPNFSRKLHDPPENLKLSKAFTLDYSPALRTICRTEELRSKGNMKRITSNRFYHYLKTLDVNFTDDMLNFACNSLT